MAESDVEISEDGKSSTYSYGAKQQLDLDKQLDAALGRTGDPAAAAALFLRWAEQNSEVRDLIPPVVEDYIKRRVAKLAKVKK